MKVIDLRQKKPTLLQVLKMAGEENLILKTSGGREFVVAESDDLQHEVALVRRNKRLMKLLEQRSTDKKKYTIAEARKKLGLSDRRP